MGFETEVKFHVVDHEAVRQLLQARGVGPARPRVFERNVVYDRPDFELRDSARLLRLRQDERVRLTFKGEVAEQEQSEAKIREEIEVEAADFAALEAILQKIGYEPKIVYEKYRETFVLDDVEIVLDELPFGLFVELEGEEAVIKRLAGELGFDWSERILTNYLALMLQAKDQLDLPFDDATFENFVGIEIDFEQLVISN